MSNAIIRAENLSKRFVIGHQRNKADALRHVIEDALRNPFAFWKNRKAEKKEFRALKDISIEIKTGETVAFSEIEKFLDTPVKRYSSGMYMRLAFAVAAHLEPEILIVDEVLAVGDSVFQNKCLGKMEDVAKAGRTVLFVSHNLIAVESLTSRVILLEGGRVM